MTKNESDSGEVDASKDNSQVDASDDNGSSDNADNSSKSQNETDEKDEKKETGDQDEKKEKKETDLEEMTYKERYGNSTKEMQAIKNDPAKLREFLGLDPDASLDEHFGSKKSDDNQDAGDDTGDDKDDSDDTDDKDDQDQGSDSDDSLPYDKMGIKAEQQVAIDMVWDNFAEKHPEIETNPKVRDALQKNFFRFLLDEAGNRRKLKSALEDTYKFISMDQDIKKAQDQARNEGIIKATANKSGAVQSSSSKTVKSQPKNELSPKQKMIAEKMGIKEEDYLKNIVKDEEED